MFNAQTIVSFSFLIIVLLLTDIIEIELPRSKIHTTYIIGILSSRDHFEQREVLRKSWLSEIENEESMQYFFIVGNRYCDLPDLMRSNQWECDKVQVDKFQYPRFYVHKAIELNSSAAHHIQKDFIFETNQNIVIKRLGIWSAFYEQLSERNPKEEVEFVILDCSNAVILLKHKFKVFRRQNVTHEGYHYFNVGKEIVVPKNVIIKFSLLNIDSIKYLANDWIPVESIRDDDYNFVRVFDLNTDTPQSLSFSNSRLTLTSFEYYIANKDVLKQKIKNLTSEKYALEQRESSVQNSLDIESKMYNDIKFVDVIDTYRNLPEKLLKFIEYISNDYSFKYFIKADDDSYVNLRRIQNYIANGTWSNKTWFGSFRKNWRINEVGKWSERAYQSIVYPPFPCGAAYVLSSYLVDWLGKNAAHLFKYQGEDVSMGIWLTSILPDYEHDNRWICEDYFGVGIEKLPIERYFCHGQLTTIEQVQHFKANKDIN